MAIATIPSATLDRPVAAASPPLTVVPPAKGADQLQREADARVTAKLALITGACVLFVLAFFLVMMILISGAAGPTV